jgi:hypothetical protein
LNQLRLICYICDLSHETEITPCNTNKKNYKTQFPTNLILNDKIKKKINLKKYKKIKQEIVKKKKNQITVSEEKNKK